MKTVEILISKDGASVEFDAKGFKGSSCKNFMEDVMRGLAKVLEETKKPEYHIGPKQGVRA